MGDGAAVALTVATIILAIIGFGAMVTDTRHYSDIYKQCQERGFVQNKTSRISCHIEVAK